MTLLMSLKSADCNLESSLSISSAWIYLYDLGRAVWLPPSMPMYSCFKLLSQARLQRGSLSFPCLPGPLRHLPLPTFLLSHKCFSSISFSPSLELLWSFLKYICHKLIPTGMSVEQVNLYRSTKEKETWCKLSYDGYGQSIHPPSGLLENHPSTGTVVP